LAGQQAATEDYRHELSSAAFSAEVLSMTRAPNKALQATAAGHGVFDIDMKFDCQICIGESGSAAVPELWR
jgi:hypothetical protein